MSIIAAKSNSILPFLKTLHARNWFSNSFWKWKQPDDADRKRRWKEQTYDQKHSDVEDLCNPVDKGTRVISSDVKELCNPVDQGTRVIFSDMEELCNPVDQSSDVEELCNSVDQSSDVEELCNSVDQSSDVEELCNPVDQSSDVEELCNSVDQSSDVEEPSSGKYVDPRQPVIIFRRTLKYPKSEKTLTMPQKVTMDRVDVGKRARVQDVEGPDVHVEKRETFSGKYVDPRQPVIICRRILMYPKHEETLIKLSRPQTLTMKCDSGLDSSMTVKQVPIVAQEVCHVDALSSTKNQLLISKDSPAHRARGSGALVLLRNAHLNFVMRHHQNQLDGANNQSTSHQHNSEHLSSDQADLRNNAHVEEGNTGVLQNHTQRTLSTSQLATDRGPLPTGEYSLGTNDQLKLSSQQYGTRTFKQLTDLLHVQAYMEIIRLLTDTELPTVPMDQLVPYYFILALAYYKTGKHQKAKEYFRECQRVPTIKKGDVAMCNIYLGDINFALGLYHRAAECYQIAIAKYDPDNLAPVFRMVPPTLSAIHAKCGSCYRNVSKSVEAINEYKKATEVSTTDKDKLTGCTSLGNLYQSLGQNTEALPEYKLSIELAESLDDMVALGWAHGNLGNAYLGLYRKDEALFHLQKSLDLTVKHEPTPAAIGRAYNNIGTAYQSMTDYDKAEEYYDLALSQAIYGNDISGQARVYGNIGNILMVRKEFERAIPHYTEVLRLSKDQSTISTAQHNRGCAYYEWAENKMTSLEAHTLKSSAADTPPHEVTCPEYRVHSTDDGLCQMHRPRLVIASIAKLYQQGMEDLRQVVAQHESKLENVKGSAKGLSLSVSLFESNSRTFHRLQDCLVNLGNWREALLVAEQSRSRTLGELMLARKGSQLENVLTPPLNLEHVSLIVSSQSSPVLYLSYTGARLLGWVLIPRQDSNSISIEMYEVPLRDDQFDGKSLDYHLRYSLTEALVEKSYEMYQSVTYDHESSAPVQNLYNLIVRPLKEILKSSECTSKKIVLVTDTYTAFVPFTCLHDSESGTFFGDAYQFQMMPSLLTLGVMDQLPEAIVTLPVDTHSMCVVGNPTIPAFYHNGSQWNLGKLPYAKREALWVGHILQTTPIMEEQATKNAVMMRIMSAQVIHIATHGNSSSGFLAFASSSTTSRPGTVVGSVQVLLHPEEVEKLSISPALVVLSSCDSGRGVVKADGIQGMARAFILAGAQAVLTTLWRAPDESAAVFMKFFYRYLVEGFESTLALQKSILSLRCFSKYSQYIHWSGYQLTGRTVRFDLKVTPSGHILNSRLGPSTSFPRLFVIKKLQSALVDSPRTPTDIQIIRGSSGVTPSEVAIDFIHTSHESFKAGIFWINCRIPELIDASLKSIEKTLGMNVVDLQVSELRKALFVLDAATELPMLDSLHKLFKNYHVHIIVLSKYFESPDSFVREVDKALIRGCKIHEIKALSMIESTQRTVHHIIKEYHFAPRNSDQKIFDKLAEFTTGSPIIVDIASRVLSKHLRETSDNPSDGLERFAESVCLYQPRNGPTKVSTRRETFAPTLVRAISDHLTQLTPAVTMVMPEHRDVWESNSEYDSWDSIGHLIDSCLSLPEELLLLRTVSMFSCSPIPLYLVIELSSLISQSSNHPHLAGLLHEQLLEMGLMKTYPLPVVYHTTVSELEAPEYVYVPQHIARQLWKCLTDQDRVVSLGLMYKTLCVLQNKVDDVQVHFMLGLCSLLQEMIDMDFDLVGRECCQEIYKLYLEFLAKVSRESM